MELIEGNKIDRHDFLCLVDSLDEFQSTIKEGFDKLDENFEKIAYSLEMIATTLIEKS